MSLTRAIYERWQTDGRLTALVPAERVFTGRAGGETTRPYAVIAGLGTQLGVRTTHAAIEIARFEFSAWVERHTDAQQVLADLRRRFDRQSFAAEDETCLLMQCDEERVVPEENDVWRAVAVYRAMQQRPVRIASE